MSFTFLARRWKSQTARQPCLPRLETLEDRLLPSLTPHLLKDIITNAGTSTAHFVNVNGVAYFSGYYSGQELWKSNGTAAGTVLVRDIRPGNTGSYPDSLTNFKGTLFFSADDGVHGRELWRSNGTGAGTMLVKDINPGSGSSMSVPFGQGVNLINVNGTLFFVANNGVSGFELWKSNGTAAGTVLVKDINPGSASSGARYLTNLNGTLFFTATNGVTGLELWKSNGTAAGTVLVKASFIGNPGTFPFNLTNLGGTLFFDADNGTTGTELWRSNGTAAGTVLVKDIFPGISGSYPILLTNVNGTLFFAATGGSANGSQLWKSNGTAAGTVLVKNVVSADPSPNYLTNVNGTLFLSENSTASGKELWKSNGTAAGTVLVKDIWPGTGYGNPKYLANVNGSLFFQANNGVGGGELWTSNGTAPGTVLISDINPGHSGSYPVGLTNINGTLFFAASGKEPWVLGPVPLAAAAPAPPAADIQALDGFPGSVVSAVRIAGGGQDSMIASPPRAGAAPVTAYSPTTGSSAAGGSGIVEALPIWAMRRHIAGEVVDEFLAWFEMKG
jgi:ELWxxDGT repeat protein